MDQEQVDTACIGDLHMGAHDSACLLRAMQHFKTQHIVGLGDMVNHPNPRLRPDQEELVALLNEARLDITPGNHDDEATLRHLFPKARLHDSFVFEDRFGRRYFVTHGDKQDPFWGTKDTPLKIAVRFFHRQLSGRMGPIGPWVKEMAKRHRQYKFVMSEIKKAVAQNAREQKCSVALYGHTHELDAAYIGDVLCLNFSDWCSRNREPRGVSYLGTLCEKGLRRHGFKNGVKISEETLVPAPVQVPILEMA